MTIRPYTPQDRQKLCDLFAELIENHKEYISHGELQMGIATDRGELAPDFRNAWLRYLDRQTADPETEIMLAEQDGTPTGFVIYGINRDGAAPYGMIYDVGLLPRHRSRGTGSLLVRTALDALREKGIADCYLESGADNHSAHRFFEKFGFGQVSCILGRNCKRRHMPRQEQYPRRAQGGRLCFLHLLGPAFSSSGKLSQNIIRPCIPVSEPHFHHGYRKPHNLIPRPICSLTKRSGFRQAFHGRGSCPVRRFSASVRRKGERMPEPAA